MKKVLCVLIAVYALFSSCSKDDVFDVDEVVVINNDGKASGDHNFIKIDDTNFYVDDIKYTAKDGDLIVTGYNPAFFKGEAKIISTLKYEGRVMKVIRIAEEAFLGCKVLTSVVIPNSMESVGHGAFWGCSALISATIGDGVSIIEHDAFSFCTNLTTLNIGKNIKTVDSFLGCEKLQTINISDLSAWCNILDITIGNGSGFAGSSGYHLYLNGKELKDLKIPNDVKCLHPQAFAHCLSIESIFIPNNIEKIENNPFYDCDNLFSIKVEEGNKFYDSRGDCNAIIEKTTNKLIVGSKETVIPAGIKCIGKAAFFGCKGLNTIDIPNSVTSIDECAFAYCTKLLSLSLSDNTDTIGDFAFAGCTGIRAIDIPDGVKTISMGSFSDCESLHTITLPKSITAIRDNAFQYCENLSSIVCYAVSPPKCDDYSNPDYPVFKGVDRETCVVYVPQGSVESYKKAYVWSSFKHIVAIEE